MNRREAIQRAAWLMGGAISAPALLGILGGCTPKKNPAAAPGFLTQEQLALIGEIAEITIPQTDTPGAKDVGIPAFIAQMLEDTYPKVDQDRYLDGLAACDSQARQQHGRSFVQLEREQQIAWVASETQAAIAAELAHAGPPSLPRPFVLMTRELTLLGYFLSQPGATQVLQYNPMPGPFRGCVPLAEAGNGRMWAFEQVQRF